MSPRLAALTAPGVVLVAGAPALARAQTAAALTHVAATDDQQPFIDPYVTPVRTAHD